MADRIASSPLGQLFGSPVKKSTLEVLQNEVASLTEERDFFKSKYSAQMDDISRLEAELKSARNQIAKLRDELIAVEMEKEKGASMGASGGNASVRSGTCSSTTTGNDSIFREGDEIPEEGDEEDGVESRSVPRSEPSAGGTEKSDIGNNIDEEENEEDADKSEDEDDAIRDHAAKMLIWANYQEVRAAKSTRRLSSSADVSVASPASSVRTPREQVPRTIHASSPVSAADSARASARSLLGLTADDDVDDDVDDGRLGDEEEEEESDYESESDGDDE